MRTSIDRTPAAGYVKRPAAVRVVADSSALTPLFIVTVYEPALALSFACEKPELYVASRTSAAGEVVTSPTWG